MNNFGQGALGFLGALLESAPATRGIYHALQGGTMGARADDPVEYDEDGNPIQMKRNAWSTFMQMPQQQFVGADYQRSEQKQGGEGTKSKKAQTTIPKLELEEMAAMSSGTMPVMDPYQAHMRGKALENAKNARSTFEAAARASGMDPDELQALLDGRLVEKSTMVGPVVPKSEAQLLADAARMGIDPSVLRERLKGLTSSPLVSDYGY